jgi:hypothetical protein
VASSDLMVEWSCCHSCGKLVAVLSALRVLAALESAVRECACVGKLCCLSVYSRLLGIAFHGELVRDCSVDVSVLSACGLGAKKEALNDRAESEYRL